MIKKIFFTLLIIFASSNVSFAKIDDEVDGITVDKIIKKHNIDINNEKDRCNLFRVIEQNYPEIFHNKNVVEHYFGPIGNYKKDMFVEDYREVALPLRDSIISVEKDIDSNRIVANMNFVGSNFIIKLKNGSMISNIYRGYIVPFDYIRLDKDYKTENKLAVLQSIPPRGNIRHFRVEKCFVTTFNNK